MRENREQRNYESRKYKRHTKRNRIIETEKYNYRSHTEARPGLRCHLRIGPDMEPARSRPSIFSSPDRLCHFSSPDRGRRFFHLLTERAKICQFSTIVCRLPVIFAFEESCQGTIIDVCCLIFVHKDRPNMTSFVSYYYSSFAFAWPIFSSQLQLICSLDRALVGFFHNVRY